MSDFAARGLEAGHTRSKLLRRAAVGTGVLVGGGAVFSGSPLAAGGRRRAKFGLATVNDPQTILNVAATAEVLATIVNTEGFNRGLGEDAVTQRNIGAAAREELIHYNVLVAAGGVPLAKSIWVPDSVFASRTNLLNTLQVGDQIFVNAYLVAVGAFAANGEFALAQTAAEFMAVEGVHRALARQSLGLLGNDRVFMRFDDEETAPGAPNLGDVGFERIEVAAAQLQAAGFGFGAQGATPGAFYDFDAVSAKTPDDPDLNTFLPEATDQPAVIEGQKGR